MHQHVGHPFQFGHDLAAHPHGDIVGLADGHCGVHLQVQIHVVLEAGVAREALLRPEAEVLAIIKKHGVGPDKTVICSCGTGREATNQFLLFKFYLGYPHVRLHEGAFTEWVSYPDNPTVTGKSPR